jgi:hypothetical protein
VRGNFIYRSQLLRRKRKKSEVNVRFGTSIDTSQRTRNPRINQTPVSRRKEITNTRAGKKLKILINDTKYQQNKELNIQKEEKLNKLLA